MLILYLGFAAMLAGWTLSSGLTTGAGTKGYYLLTILVLAGIGILFTFLWRKQKNLYTCCLVVLVLNHVGASLAYRMNQADSKILYSKQFFKDFLAMCVIFLAVYLCVRYTKLYRLRIINLLILAGIPVVQILTRAIGEKNGGAYITLFGILVFGPILAAYPFAAAYFVSKPEEGYLNGSVRSMPFHLSAFLLYNFILYALCAICNEFGLLLVMGITSTLLFFLRCRNLKTKAIYTAVCAGGALLACVFTGHIRDRVIIWLNLSNIVPGHKLEGQAESILYLYRNLPRSGFWGSGLATVPVSIYPKLNTDHAFVALILEYSIIFAAGVLICGALLVRSMLAGCQTDDMYDYILNLSCALILGSMILIHIGSCLGSIITAGIGFPYVSDGICVNAMVTVLVAIHCAIYERGRKYAL